MYRDLGYFLSVSKHMISSFAGFGVHEFFLLSSHFKGPFFCFSFVTIFLSEDWKVDHRRHFMLKHHVACYDCQWVVLPQAFLLLHLVTFIHSQSPLGSDKFGILHQMF
jgi:hypothetical protein